MDTSLLAQVTALKGEADRVGEELARQIACTRRLETELAQADGSAEALRADEAACVAAISGRRCRADVLRSLADVLVEEKAWQQKEVNETLQDGRLVASQLEALREEFTEDCRTFLISCDEGRIEQAKVEAASKRETICKHISQLKVDIDINKKVLQAVVEEQNLTKVRLLGAIRSEQEANGRLSERDVSLHDEHIALQADLVATTSRLGRLRTKLDAAAEEKSQLEDYLLGLRFELPRIRDDSDKGRMKMLIQRQQEEFGKLRSRRTSSSGNSNGNVPFKHASGTAVSLSLRPHGYTSLQGTNGKGHVPCPSCATKVLKQRTHQILSFVGVNWLTKLGRLGARL
eukprot:SM000287S10636  [mRNA]  locus=s287:126396:128883:- [translate_table: standard]